jgi:chromodomain-helicase-DNA-binding protein 4
MIDDTLKKRGQLQLVYNRPLRLVEKGKSSVSGSAKAVKSNTMKAPSTQPSSSCPEPAPDRQVRYQFYNVPSSSTSARGGTAETPAPRKRPSDAPSVPMKRQKTDKYPGCPVCGGPHHLVKDCPTIAEGPKRYCTAISDFIMSLLITSWAVYTLRSPDWSLNQGSLPLSLHSVKF